MFMLIVLCNKESSIKCDLAASFPFQTVICLVTPFAGIEDGLLGLQKNETFSDKDIVAALHLAPQHDVG